MEEGGREGKAGSPCLRSHSHKSHPFSQAGDTWLLQVRLGATSGVGGFLLLPGNLPRWEHHSHPGAGGRSLARLLRASLGTEGSLSSCDIQSQPYPAGSACSFHEVGTKTIPGSPTALHAPGTGWTRSTGPHSTQQGGWDRERGRAWAPGRTWIWGMEPLPCGGAAGPAGPRRPRSHSGRC